MSNLRAWEALACFRFSDDFPVITYSWCHDYIICLAYFITGLEGNAYGRAEIPGYLPVIGYWGKPCGIGQNSWGKRGLRVGLAVGTSTEGHPLMFRRVFL